MVNGFCHYFSQQLVYLVKNASHMPVESVLSAVLGMSSSQSTGMESQSSSKKKTSLIGSRKQSADQFRQKVSLYHM